MRWLWTPNVYINGKLVYTSKTMGHIDEAASVSFWFLFRGSAVGTRFSPENEHV